MTFLLDIMGLVVDHEHQNRKLITFATPSGSYLHLNLCSKVHRTSVEVKVIWISATCCLACETLARM